MTASADREQQLLHVEDLVVEFTVGSDQLRAVDNVSFDVGRGEIVGLVGESASGKSTLGLAIMRMVPGAGRVTAKSLRFLDREVYGLTSAELRAVRGRHLALVVQDALATMNPVITVGEHVTQVMRDHGGRGKRSAFRERTVRIFREVQLSEPEAIMDRYPHELSGGMQQRVAIAQGLVLGPSLIIADEPTTALDVTVQAQILALLKSIVDERGTSIIFITHDLATVAEICDRVMVMYAGRIVESGAVSEVFADPRHPYTRALLASLLPLDGDPPDELAAIPGQPPQPDEWPAGCRFRPRCPLYQALGEPEACRTTDPMVDEAAPHWAACHFVDKREQL